MLKLKLDLPTLDTQVSFRLDYGQILPSPDAATAKHDSRTALSSSATPAGARSDAVAGDGEWWEGCLGRLEAGLGLDLSGATLCSIAMAGALLDHHGRLQVSRNQMMCGGCREKAAMKCMPIPPSPPPFVPPFPFNNNSTVSTRAR